MYERPLPPVDANDARRKLPRDEKLVDDGLTVEEAAAAIGIGRTIAFNLVSTGKLESYKVGNLRRVSRKAIKRFLEGPIAIIGESVVDDETARLAIVETEGVRCCELSVVRGDQREALTFDARVLITWRKELSDQRMLDHLWRHGFNFTPNDPDNSRPRPCPGVLAQASEADGTPVVVQIIETDKGRISEVVRGAGGDAQRIRLSVRHWNAWRNAMKRAALVAWRSGCDIPSSALITV